MCTVPLPVLNKISFTPPLSDEKTLASNGGYDYTDSTRLYTQFSERFWLADNLNGWGDTNWPEEVWQPTWDNGESSGIMQSYLRNFTATELDTFDKGQQIESVHTRWQYVFPSTKISTDPRTGISRRHHVHENGLQKHNSITKNVKKNLKKKSQLKWGVPLV